MADDYDPWNPDQYAPSQQAQWPAYEPGQAYMLGGSSSNDPLMDWASNMSPRQLQDFAMKHATGNSDAAIQSMVDAGIPPPSQHYGLSAPTQAPPTFPGVIRDPSQGNVTSDLNTPPKKMAFAGTDVDSGQNPWEPHMGEENKVDPGSQISRFNRWRNPNDPNNPPAPAAPAPAPKTAVPPMPPPTEVKPAPDVPENFTPADQKKETPEDKAKKLAELKKKNLKDEADALSEFSKSLQGVKAPPRPELPKIGAPSVRQASSVGAPNINNLLAMAGQVPTAQTFLSKLLGRG